MTKEIKIGIVGFGMMGSACGLALKRKGKKYIYIYDQDSQKTAGYKNFYIAKSAEELIEKSDIVILAVKPQDIKTFLAETKECFIRRKILLISLAAGVSTKFFEKNITAVRVIRVMPNLAAKAGSAVSFFSKGKFVKNTDVISAQEIFSSVGKVFEISENYLDKVTSITGSGPGYIYYFLQCFYESALSLGFNQSLAKEMITQTFLGTADLVRAQSVDFKGGVKNVASRGGTTQAALAVWEKSHFKDLIESGITAAYLRAKQLNIKE